MRVVIIALVITAVSAQVPCIGWDITSCRTSCLCGWCHTNSTGVCMGKDAQCPHTFYTIAQSEPCQALYDHPSVVLTVFLSVLFAYAVGGCLYGGYLLYTRRSCMHYDSINA